MDVEVGIAGPGAGNPGAIVALQLCLPVSVPMTQTAVALQHAANASGLAIGPPTAEPWPAFAGPSAEGGTWRIDLRTPWPLPCPLHQLQAHHLWLAAVQGLRTWGVTMANGTQPAGRLVWPYARWQPAPGCTHGTLVGPVFIVAAGTAWGPVLHALQPLHLAAGPAAGPLGWRGAFRISPQCGGWLDLGLTSRRRLRHSAGVADGEGDDARMPLPDPTDPASWQSPGAVAHGLAADLRDGRYRPGTSQAVALHRPGKPVRWVERLPRRDAIVQRHLLDLLGPVCERSFHPMSFGFRPGLGRPQALRAVHDGLAAGCTHVVETDIAQCFESLPHDKVWQALDAVLLPQDRLLRTTLQAVLGQPCAFDDTPRPRLSGLAQGAPLSPLLANLVLSALDHAMAALPVRCVRYADDLLVLTNGKTEARRALDLLHSSAASLGLRLAAEKTRIGHVQQGFSFLGEHFGPHSVEPVEAAAAAQRKPLVVTWPWLELGVNGPCLEARHAGKPLGRWPLRRLSTLLVLAPAALSTSLLERCATHQVAVALRG